MGLNELVEISNKYGNDENYVLAGGGNTSLKDDKYIYIKASGTSLATITKEGFVKLNREKLNKIWDKSYSDNEKEREEQVLSDLMDARETGEEKKRPSVETLLHNILPHNYVVHLHPALVNGLTCSVRGKEEAASIFGDLIIWIDNIEPGYRLAKKVNEELFMYSKKYNRSCQIIFLQNHGVFVSGNTTDEIDYIYNEIIKKLSERITNKPDITPIELKDDRLTQTIDTISKDLTVKFIKNKSLDIILKNQGKLSFSNALTPDHIVYCKAYPIIANNKEIMLQIDKYQKKYGYKPRIIIFPEYGALICGENEENVQTVSKVYLDAIKIAVYAESFGGLSLMPQHLVEFIMNWEAESYRSSVNNQ